jgi:hypothetical protein
LNAWNQFLNHPLILLCLILEDDAFEEFFNHFIFFSALLQNFSLLSEVPFIIQLSYQDEGNEYV